MNEKTMRIWILIPILAAVIITCLILYIAGVAGSVVCFGVDSSDRLYVGFGDTIQVYEGDTVIKELSPKTSKTYLFTILSDDTLILTTASIDYKLDLDGNVIEQTDNAGTQLYYDLRKEKREFISQKGDIYRMENILGQTQIKKNGAVVYREPLVSVIAGYAVLISIAILLLCIPKLISKTRDGL